MFVRCSNEVEYQRESVKLLLYMERYAPYSNAVPYDTPFTVPTILPRSITDCYVFANREGWV